MKKTTEETEITNSAQSRRSFMKYAGMSAGATALLIAGCKKTEEKPTPPPPPPPPPTAKGVDLGSGDIGILNYAYALEQLEAAFYTAVVTHPSFTNTFAKIEEQIIIKDIYSHEVVHREFFKAALGAKAIGALEVDFTNINFADRLSVLNTAKVFEDLGVSAYNGAGKLISNAGVAYLGIAGKIVSVEAKHAAVIRDMLSSSSQNSPDFSGDDVVAPVTGLDVAKCPAEVLAAAATYLKTKIISSNLPTC